MPIPILHTKETEHFRYCYHPWPKYEEKGGFVWRLNGIDTKRVCSLSLPPCQFVLDDRPDLSPSPLFRWSMTPLPIPFIVCPPPPPPNLTSWYFLSPSLFLLSRCFLLPPFDCQVWGKNWIVIRRQSQRPLTRIPIHTPPPRRVSEIRLILLFAMRNLTMEIFFVKMFSSSRSMSS